MIANDQKITVHPDKIKFRILVILIVFSTSAVILFFQSAYLFDPHKFILHKLINLGHIPLFAIIAWMVLLALNIKNPKTSNWPPWSYAVAFIGSAAIGFFSEVAQIFTPRDASIKDFLFNIIGVGLSLSIGLLWFNHQVAEIGGKFYKKLQIIFIISSVIILSFAINPFISSIIDEIEIRKAFPVIASFETERELKRWDSGDNKTMLSREHADDGEYSLRTTLSPGKYSGINMPNPPKDWREFDFFSCTIFNPSQKNIEVMLKIFDRGHNHRYEDRFNKLMKIYPGKNIVSVVLREIESAPANRRMNIAEIAQISFIMKDLRHPQNLYFDNIRLLK